MMRLLVLSDSHNDVITLKMAIDNNSDADVVIFLGDGAKDFETISNNIQHKQIFAVKGNCDGTLCNNPAYITVEFAGAKLYCTHGYNEKVKFGLNMLKECSRERNANIVLFGHTHNPYVEYDNGLYLMNPGSVKENSCGIVDITSKGIICFTKNIVT